MCYNQAVLGGPVSGASRSLVVGGIFPLGSVTIAGKETTLVVGDFFPIDFERIQTTPGGQAELLHICLSVFPREPQSGRRNNFEIREFTRPPDRGRRGK